MKLFTLFLFIIIQSVYAGLFDNCTVNKEYLDQRIENIIEKYPNSAINGPIVCLTNEHAGSDGDIFSHAFKLMKIGKLIGKRTWGGVIGMWPRLGLNDGSLTTQPEFSHWFEDVGYDVENYGTEPDIEVDILPSDYAKGIDPQLDRSIKEALKDFKKNHLSMDGLNKKKPNLKLPKLPI
ncbi:S41 family peptidase [Bacteriovoracaceae bacterium]|nr:S41 family peptidase [Bacteriovoracaceae bacterium]